MFVWDHDPQTYSSLIVFRSSKIIEAHSKQILQPSTLKGPHSPTLGEVPIVDAHPFESP